MIVNMRSIVVAYGNNREIGQDGQLPWAGDMPADMKRFKNLTLGDTVIMGRNTFESLPDRFRPLPDRQNIVLSMGMAAGVGFVVARSIEEALEVATHDNVHVIGGERVYRQTLPIVDKIYATEIDVNVESADAYFPEIDDQDWILEDRIDFAADEKNKFDYSFVTYSRRD